jgi:hypothetical protein
VIFVPEWPKGSLLVCNWPHSVGQNHFFVMMLFNRDSAIQSASRRFYTVYTVYKSKKLDPLQPSRRRDILSKASSVRTMRTFHPDLHLCQEASNCSSLPPSGHFSSTSERHSVFDQLWDFFQNTDMGRSLQPSGRCGIPSGCAHP